MGAIVLRAFAANDRRTLVAFAEALQDNERKLHASRRPGKEISRVYVDDLLRNVITKQGMIEIAERDGTPVGFVACWAESENDPLLRGPHRTVIQVTDVYIVPDERGRGLARRLLAAAEDHARQLGIGRLLIGALAANEMAIAAYRRYGFQPYEILFEKPVEPEP